MQLLALFGAKRGKDGKPTVECLYCGLNGVDLQEMADEAAKSGEYIAIGKIVNPSVTPMSISAVKTVGTTPTFPKRELPKQKVAPKPATAQLKEAGDLSAKLRAERLKVQAAEQKGEQPGKPPVAAAQLRTDGPTLEEFTAAGYKAENYPPAGYAEKDSPALKLYKESQKTSAPEKGGASDASTGEANPPATS